MRVGRLVERTADYRRLWVRKESPPVAEPYKPSLPVLSTQIDWQGGILASNDSDIIQFNPETYSYIWPRDEVLAEQLHPLTGESLSVSLLTWSLAALIATTRRLLVRMARTRICPACGSPSMPYIQRGDWIEKLYTNTCDSIHGLCKV